MDYETLFNIIPKETKKWSLDDVSQWLQFIGLTNLQNTFSIIQYNGLAENSIDGSCLELIEENDLSDDLGISNKIVRKKLMHCILYIIILGFKIGLKEYNLHIKEKFNSMQIEDK